MLAKLSNKHWNCQEKLKIEEMSLKFDKVWLSRECPKCPCNILPDLVSESVAIHHLKSIETYILLPKESWSVQESFPPFGTFHMQRYIGMTCIDYSVRNDAAHGMPPSKDMTWLLVDVGLFCSDKRALKAHKLFSPKPSDLHIHHRKSTEWCLHHPVENVHQWHVS